MNIIKCITAEIYKHRHGNCANGGISSRYNEVLFPVDGGNLEVDTDNPPDNLVRIVRLNIFGREYVHVEPWGLKDQCCMYGGTLVETSDSRFDEAINNGGYPVKLFDRVECMNEIMSND